MTYKEFKKISVKVAEEFDVTPICVQRIWYSVFDFICTKVEELPSFSTITEEEFNRHVTNFLIPGGFRLQIDYDRIQSLNNHREYDKKFQKAYFGEERFNEMEANRAKVRYVKKNRRIIDYGKRK